MIVLLSKIFINIHLYHLAYSSLLISYQRKLFHKVDIVTTNAFTILALLKLIGFFNFTSWANAIAIERFYLKIIRIGSIHSGKEIFVFAINHNTPI